jgi:hypothetical protein
VLSSFGLWDANAPLHPLGLLFCFNFPELFVQVSGGARERKTFIVDHPFIFYIYDRINNLPIFVGRIVDPTGKNK